MQDFSEEISDPHEKLGHAHNSIHQTSDIGEFDANDRMDVPHSNSCKEDDDPFVESQEGNFRLDRFVYSLSYHSVCKRVNHI